MNKLEQIENRDNLDFLKELNEQQKQAVFCQDKSICVIAGAGCGKTKTLISRVAYLLKAKIANPEQILLLTFSKKAIEEVRNRIEKLLGVGFKQHLDIFNIHSFAYKFLRKHSHLLGYQDSQFQVYDSKHQEEVIKHILEIDLDLIPDSKLVRTIASKISFCKLQKRNSDNSFNFSLMKE
jgi:DNA helicase II / ATP-dependent DNA helicase PcrA